MRPIIDFHSHIIPKIDDGSHDMNMTKQMLNEEDEQGVDTVVVTPHFYAHKNSIEDFLNKREKRLGEMRAAISSESSSKLISETSKTIGETSHRAIEKTIKKNGNVHFPNLLAGAEVYYFHGMGKAERLSDLCIEGTDLILVEMPFAQWTENIYRDIRRIITDRNLKVVLAHIERYPEFQKSKDIWDRVMALPLVTQINAGSFLKGWRKRRFCLDWIKAGVDKTESNKAGSGKGSGHAGRIPHPPSVLGSDCHNLTSRPPNIKDAREIIRKKAGDIVLGQIDQTAAGLLGLLQERNEQ